MSMSGDRMSVADLSEAESDTSSIMGDTEVPMKPPSPASREQMQKRIESLVQEKRVLTMEVETYKLRVKQLMEDNKALKHASVQIQAKAEQEEEMISNSLMRKIHKLTQEKEQLAINLEQEEECLTNDLSRKLNKLKQDKAELAVTLQQEQESQMNKLLRRIDKLESETGAKQTELENLRREKVELENTLEQEQESLVNRLWKRMDKLEAEKRMLQSKLEQPLSAPPSPMDIGLVSTGASASHSPQSVSASVINSANALDVSTAAAGASLDNIAGLPPPTRNDSKSLMQHVQLLRNEVANLKRQLKTSQSQQTTLSREEQQFRDENLRLRRKLQMEVERREQLCRTLSESESSLEMEDERHFNELTSAGHLPRNRTPSFTPSSSSAFVASSNPAPNNVGVARPVSPSVSNALNVNVGFYPTSGQGLVPSFNASPVAALRCAACGYPLPTNPNQIVNPSNQHGYPPCSNSPPTSGSTSALNLSSVSSTQQQHVTRTRSVEKGGVGDKFLRPTDPPLHSCSGSGSRGPSPAPQMMSVSPGGVSYVAGGGSSGGFQINSSFNGGVERQTPPPVGHNQGSNN